MYNPYRVLEVSSSLSKQEIKSKYKKLSKTYHPDNLVTGNVVKFQEIKKAWEYIDKYHKESRASPLNKGFWRHKSIFTVFKEEKKCL